MNTITIKDIVYNFRFNNSKKIHSKSISVVGIDTEAFSDGKCFMVATSLGDVFSYNQIPNIFFNRRYRGCNFVAYNLKYDEGALLQFLPADNLRELWETGKTKYQDYVVKCIPTKLLSIRKSKNTVHIYDMYNFYMGSLDYNAKKYLNKEKIDIETKTFTKEYVNDNWDKIGEYCVQDAILVQELAELLIKKFEGFGIFPQKLFSTAYISYQYFKSKCNYIVVKRFWDEDQKLLDYALQSYNGGKFEVTEKGIDNYYEYDIVSAYPAEIANLVDITHARIVWSKQYRRYATYGFIRVKMKIPVGVFSPVAVKSRDLNIYPCGLIEKIITKTEYDYLITQKVDITIIDAVYLHCDYKKYPYRQEVEKLVEMKSKMKEEGKVLDYHTIKIFLNSLYGKFCQLIKKGNKYHASNCWNPIYASIITANVRTIISNFQSQYQDIVAVHTDSIISKKELNIKNTGMLGDMIYETNGAGVILGAGIYQVGEKNKFRGFSTGNKLMETIDVEGKSIDIEKIRPYTWREVAFHGWTKDLINRFTTLNRKLSVDFDRKRIWLNDWQDFREVKYRKVLSLPIVATRLGV